MTPPSIPYAIEPAKTGVPTLYIMSAGKRMPVHSVMDPLRESGTFADRFQPERYDVLVVLGTGLGYHLMELRDRLARYRSILCIDILGSLEAEIRHNRHTAFLAESPQVHFIFGEDAGSALQRLAPLIDMGTARGISVIEHPTSFRLFPDYYGAWREAVNQTINAQAGNRATIKAFGRRYIDNILANTRHLADLRPVRGLFGAFSEFPAIMVVPGPSLDDHLADLADLQERCFIVAVDSALPVLRHGGIGADLVVSIDPQPYIAEHLADTGTVPWVPVYAFSVNPVMPRHRGGFVSLTSHPLCQLAEAVYGDAIGSIDSAVGSVAGDALRLCDELGFRAVGIVGLDCAYPRGSIYARGSAYQDRYGLYQHNRMNTIETANQRYIRTASGNIIMDGLKTRRSLLGYKAAIERFLAGMGSTFHSIAGRGLALAGIGETTLGVFGEAWCGTVIQKRDRLREKVQAVKTMAPESYLTALKQLARGDDLPALLEESLGRPARDEEIRRYRRRIASLG